MLICTLYKHTSLAIRNSAQAFSTIEGPRTALPSCCCRSQSIRVFHLMSRLEFKQDGRSDAGRVEFVERLIFAFAHPCHPLHLSMQPPFQCRNGAAHDVWRDGADHACVSIAMHSTARSPYASVQIGVVQTLLVLPNWWHRDPLRLWTTCIYRICCHRIFMSAV
jgi:hypothetical protein